MSATKQLNELLRGQVPADPQAYELSTRMLEVALPLGRMAQAVFNSGDGFIHEAVSRTLDKAADPHERMLNRLEAAASVLGCALHATQLSAQTPDKDGRVSLGLRGQYSGVCIQNMQPELAQALEDRMKPLQALLQGSFDQLTDALQRIDSKDPVRNWNLDLYAPKDAADFQRSKAAQQLLAAHPDALNDGANQLQVSINGRPVSNVTYVVCDSVTRPAIAPPGHR